MSWPTNFPPLFSQIRGGKVFDEYITSYWSIVVVVMTVLLSAVVEIGVPEQVARCTPGDKTDIACGFCSEATADLAL
jgi:hypothetical protein